MNAHDQRILWSSDESDWRTEPDLYYALDQEACFEIDLAADARSAYGPIRGTAGTRWLGPGSPLATDGLAADWMALAARYDFAPVGFLNNPFSRRKANAYRTGRIKVDRPGGGTEWRPHPKDAQIARTYEMESWAAKCWEESRRGFTIYAVLPFAPQTEWYRKYVYGHSLDTNIMGERLGTVDAAQWWSGHAATEERRFPHRLNFLRPDGTPAANAGVNSVVIKWEPTSRRVGPWTPAAFYWSHR